MAPTYVHAVLRTRVAAGLRALAREGALPELDPVAVDVVAARGPEHGEVVSNAALVLGGQAGLAPRTLAALLAGKLREHADVAGVEVAGPGFLNLRMAPGFWHGAMSAILEAGEDYGRCDLGRGARIDVAGGVGAEAREALWRLPIGQGRAALVADALGRLLAFADYDVRRTDLSAGAGGLGVGGCAPVRLTRGGVTLPAGTVVSLQGLVDEIGADAVRFLLLCSKPEAPLDLDLAGARELCRHNPVFHVQYAHARAKAILRRAAEFFPQLHEGAPEVLGSDLSLLSDPDELALIRRMAFFPQLIETAAGAREPHRIAHYLYDSASCFHTHYERGTDLPHLRAIQPGVGTLTAARLALVQANAHVLAAGLKLLGVLAPTEMQ